MQFTKQTITILNRYSQHQEMHVMACEESGLAYYRSPNGEGITITTINSGYAVVNLWNLTANKSTAHDEEIAQRFIENIAPLLDWTQQSYNAIMEQARFCYGDMQAVKPHIKKAFSDACEQVQALHPSK